MNSEIYRDNIEDAYRDFEAIYDEIDARMKHIERDFEEDNFSISCTLDFFEERAKEAIKMLNIMLENIDDAFEQLNREDRYDNEWDKYPENGYLDRDGNWRELND